MTDASEQPFIRRAIILVCGVLVVAALHFGREVLIPVALALFFGFLLAPAARTLERLRLGRVAAVILVVTACFGTIAALGWLVGTQGAGLADELQKYRDNIVSKIRQLRVSVSGASQAVESFSREIGEPLGQPESLPADDDAPGVERAEGGPPAEKPASLPADANAAQPAAQADEGDSVPPVKVQVVSPRENLVAALGRLVGPVVHPLATVGVTAVLVIFFLIYREDLRDRVIRLCGRAHIQVTTTALVDSGKRVTRYLAAQALANGLIGLTIGLGLWALGIPSAALWGLVAGVFRFVPYIGALVAASFPAALALAVSDGWLQPALVVGWIVLVDLLSANFLEPWLYGVRTGASPTAILFSFLFWTWLWGGVGLFLATPITVCLVVLGKHIPAFEMFYILLGDEPALEPQTRFYQRILALDEREAVQVARRFAEEASLIQACEQIVLPALAQLEYDRNAGLLDDARIQSARHTVLELLRIPGSEQPTPSSEHSTTASDPSRLFVLVLDRGSFDDLVPAMLARIAGGDPSQLHVLSKESLSTEVVEEIRRLDPSGVVLVAIQPRDAGRIRHVCKRLLQAAVTCPIHIAVFTSSRRESLGYMRLARQQAVRIHTGLTDLLGALGRSVKPQ